MEGLFVAKVEAKIWQLFGRVRTVVTGQLNDSNDICMKTDRLVMCVQNC